jgi:heme exporter protein C
MDTYTRLMERIRPFLQAAALILVPVSLYLVFLYAPVERILGPSQKIFYYHVPSAISCFVGFFLVLVGSVMYLLTRRRSWDALAGASAEVGVLFCAIVLVTGPLWAKPAWGVYWTWDVRLTTTLIMALMYAAYLMLKVSAREDPQRAVMSAIYGIVCFVNVPVVHFSVRLFRSVHPLLFKADSTIRSALTGEMWATFGFCMVTVFTLFGWILLERLALSETEDAMEELREMTRVQIEVEHPKMAAPPAAGPRP